MNAEFNLDKVVVGVDASDESSAALAWARAVTPPSAEIVALHTWHFPVTSSYDAVLVTAPDDVERLAQAGLDERVADEGDERLVAVLRQGHAGRAIVGEGEDADMIVVGHHGESRLAMMLGSTANYVVHHTERPVVIVRAENEAPPKHVVVGVDDFDDPIDSPSVRALQWAWHLPGVERVTAVHAWYLPPLAVGVFPAAVDEMAAMDDAAQAVADRVVAAAGPPPDGVEVVGKLARGTPGFALIEASKEADLVVVGRRGRGGFSELLLGSTSAETAAHAHAAVAIIR